VSTIKIILHSTAHESYCYKICGCEIISNQRFHSLSAFLSNASKALLLENIVPDSQGKLIFSGVSWLAEKHREIICSNSSQGYFINVPQISQFIISHDGSIIYQFPNADQLDDLTVQQFESTLLGPPLMLALALNGYFGLHASSVEVASKAILFTGESGFGKSTMAKYLQAEVDCKRLSDDISVVSMLDSRFILNADFPQLKLLDQLQNTQTDNRELGAVIVLDRHDNEVEISLTKLDRMRSMEILLNHSVAAQLFDKTLTKQHLNHLAELSKNTPVYKLIYPSGFDNIKAIAKILKDEFD